MIAIQQQRKDVLEQIMQLVEMRRGSIVNQMIESVGADGKPHRRGPYPIYSFKESGKTVSRRLTTPALVDMYRQHIEQGRRFQELVAQLMRLGEQLSDHALESATQKKTPKPKSRPNSKLRACFKP
jgi:hypothetical protein